MIYVYCSLSSEDFCPENIISRNGINNPGATFFKSSQMYIVQSTHGEQRSLACFVIRKKVVLLWQRL